MSRVKKAVEWDEQPYNCGDYTVLVRWKSGKRPRMIQNDTQIVIGESQTQFVTGMTVAPLVTATLTPQTNRTLDAEGEAAFQALRAAGLKQRESAAAIAASGDGAEGALTEKDIREFTTGLEAAVNLGGGN